MPLPTHSNGGSENSVSSEVESLRQALEKQRAHASQEIQRKAQENNLLRDQLEKKQLQVLNQSADNMDLSASDWWKLFPGMPEQPSVTRKEPKVPKDNLQDPTLQTPPASVGMTKEELFKAMQEYDEMKAQKAAKEAQRLMELNQKFHTEHKEVAEDPQKAALYNDVWNTLQNAPRSPEKLYDYTIETAKRLEQRMQPNSQPPNPYSSQGFGQPPNYAPQNNRQASVFDVRDENARMQDWKNEAKARKSKWTYLGVDKPNLG